MLGLDARIDALSSDFFIDVDFSDVHFSDMQIQKLTHVLHGNSFLRSFNIAGCGLSDNHICMILDVVLKSSSLAVLNLSRNALCVNAINKISAFIADSCMIREIYISDNDDGHLKSPFYNVLDALFKAVSKNQSLKVLDLSGNLLGLYEATDALSELFLRNQTLETLLLKDSWESWNAVDDNSFFVKFAESLATNKSIRILDLSSCYSYIKDAQALAIVLSNNKTLESFKICIDEMNFNTAIQIGCSVASNNSLMELQLFTVSDIDEKVKEMFVRYMCPNKSLLFLDVGVQNSYYIECELKYRRSYVNALLDAVVNHSFDKITYRDFLFHKDQMCYMAYKKDLPASFIGVLEGLYTSMLYKMHCITDASISILPYDLIESIMKMSGEGVHQKICKAYGIGDFVM